MGFDLPDTNSIASEFDALINGVGLLSDGVGRLSDGTNELAKGILEAKNGSDLIQTGLNTLSGDGNLLLQGSTSILNGIVAINQSFQNSGLGDLPAALHGIANTLDMDKADGVGVAADLMTLYGQFEAAYTTLTQSISGIPGQTVNEEKLDALLAQYPDNTTLADLVANYKETHGAVTAIRKFRNESSCV